MLVPPPVTFQGGKQRLAAAIVEAISPRFNEPFYDLCCGSGAITIEVVRRGLPVDFVRMVDNGPWGLVWEEVSTGTFSLDALRRIVAAIPERVAMQADFLRELRKQSVDIDTSATFLVLQAGAFGGLAVYFDDGRWSNANNRGGIRTAWQSKDDPRKRTNTLMPCGTTIVRRMQVLCEMLRGVTVERDDFATLTELQGTVYIDPPYLGTAGYGRRDVSAYDFTNWARVNSSASVWVSEARPLFGKSQRMSGSRRQGGMRGGSTAPIEEWLTQISFDACVETGKSS